MGQRQNDLRTIVQTEFNVSKQPKPTKSQLLDGPFRREVYEVYHSLNGQLKDPPTAFKNWDIPTDRFIIELDEENHFNRYRSVTLNSNFYKGNQSLILKDYQSYCYSFESKCRCDGAYWNTKTSDAQFGPSDPPGILGERGSSRWRQRAYYDFLRDVSSKILGIPLIRIAIYDTWKSSIVDKVLKKKLGAEIKEFIIDVCGRV